MPELIFELGTEELPAGFIDPALAWLDENVKRALTDARLAYGTVTCEGTPRRLAVLVRDVAERQPDLEETKVGPPASIAKNPDGSWSQATLGFLKKNNLEGAQLFEKDGKMAARFVEAGKPAFDALGPLLEGLIGKIPFKKNMSWGDARVTHKQVFPRPLQWILAVFNKKPLAVAYADVVSGAVTYGHRYHAPAAVPVTTIAEYERALDNGHVVLSRAARKQRIVEEAGRLASAAGGTLRPDDALLEIVKNLVEKPFPVLGRFEERFLEMPPELLVSEMREHQKYFAVQNNAGALLPCFVVVAGADSADKAGLAAGNARVLRARFEDGAFYFRTDRERSLASRVEDLERLVFHRDLGTVRKKVERIEQLSAWLAGAVRLDGNTRERAMRAAHLSKADLTTGVVNEFPELQGIMGRTYAGHDGERPDVALAIDDHYAPRNAGAALPRTHEGAVVGIADRVDTLVGIVGIGKAPTGSADPFALRRAAIAVLHIAMDRGYAFSLAGLVHEAVRQYRAQGRLTNVDDKKLEAQVLELLRGRLRGVLLERCAAASLGGADDIVDAAMAAKVGVDDLVDVEARTLALARMRGQDRAAFLSLAATFKRIGNILNKARSEGALVGEPGDRLTAPAELDLHAAVRAAHAGVQADGTHADRKREALESIANLKPAVDRFFDDVMVMADDHALRGERLGLLASIERKLEDVADFTKVQTDA